MHCANQISWRMVKMHSSGDVSLEDALYFWVYEIDCHGVMCDLQESSNFVLVRSEKIFLYHFCYNII